MGGKGRDERMLDSSRERQGEGEKEMGWDRRTEGMYVYVWEGGEVKRGREKSGKGEERTRSERAGGQQRAWRSG